MVRQLDVVTPVATPPVPEDRRAVTIRLAVLFGLLYFVQGIAEPTEGLVSQPVRSLLRGWGWEAGAIGAFMATVGLPWSFKPLYGLVTDFVPLAGTHRRSWLLVGTAVGGVSLVLLGLFPPGPEHAAWLRWGVLLPCLGVAFTDVVVDALMVQRGQPLGITGTLQSVQWTCIYAASILTGWLGGQLAASGSQPLGFLIAGCAMLGSLGVVLVGVREERAPPVTHPGRRAREALVGLVRAATDPGVALVGAWLFLWSFNPFTTSVQYLHATETLGLGDAFYGWLVSLQGLASVVAASLYGLYCRRLSLGALLHLSVAMGVVGTLCWWGFEGEQSGVAVALAWGFTYMTGLIVQLDVAARLCPPDRAGTVFALLMALSNLATSLGEGVGGSLLERWTAAWGPHSAYDGCVAVGAATTACCWVMVPWLRRLGARVEAAVS